MEIDFNRLKYNLYDILNIKHDATSDMIKTKFRKIIKNFHPDKNCELEEDIYYHIILANQVLNNKEMREKYDYHIKNKESSFIELKKGFNQELGVQSKYDVNNFTIEMERLNNMHGYTAYNDNNNIIDKFNKLKNQSSIPIKKEDISTSDDFNKLFDKKNDTTIIQYKEPSELSSYVVGEYYTNINDINKLYVEDDVECVKYTNLNRAFSLQPNMNQYIKNDNKTYETKMKEYNNLTIELNKIQFSNSINI